MKNDFCQGRWENATEAVDKRNDDGWENKLDDSNLQPMYGNSMVFDQKRHESVMGR